MKLIEIINENNRILINSNNITTVEIKFETNNYIIKIYYKAGEISIFKILNYKVKQVAEFDYERIIKFLTNTKETETLLQITNY